MRSALMLVVLACAWIGAMGATAGRADAAGVTLADASPANASSCQSGTASSTFLLFGTPFKVSNPAGAATGDVLILTLRTSNESNFLGNFTMPDAQLVRWTALQSSGSTRTYYRVRGGGDPAQYTLVSGLALVSASANLVATVTAFSGADPTNPVAGGSTQATGSGNGAVALPDAPIARGGSMRYSTIATDKSSTFDFTGAAPMTESCNEQTAAATTTGAYEPALGPPDTPTHSVALSGANGPAWFAATFVIQPALSPCNTGGLNLTQPSTITFPPTTLNGLDQTVTTTANFTIDDQTGLMAGWNLSGTSTIFKAGAALLPTTAMTITSVTATPAPGNCSTPSNVVGWPLTLPAAIIAPVASKLFNANWLSGSGPVNLAVGLKLAIPATTKVGTYSSTWTMTLAAGP